MPRYYSKLQSSADVETGELLSAETEGTLTPEQLADDVARTQEKLANLRREQDVLERQKRELEDLARRQGEFQNGREELIDKLTRGLAFLERQTSEGHRRVEQLEGATGNFRSHLSNLEAIVPTRWSQAEAGKELTRALGLLDIARNDYNQARGKLLGPEVDGADASDDAGGLGGAEQPFIYWLKAGLAFTLPLLIVGLMIFCILCWRLWRPA
jgi:septal ring factor EnvC (AmiA/AmiB activator)